MVWGNVETLSERIERIVPAKQGERFQHNRERYTVGAPCQNKHGGKWFCIIHKQAFDNQMQKDSHISEYGSNGSVRHKLVWWCFEHGPEQP